MAVGTVFGYSILVVLVVICVVVVLFIFAVLAAYFAVRAHLERTRSGLEGLVGMRGESKTDLDPNGTVFVDGARWKGVSVSGRIPEGAEIEVVSIEKRGSALRVRGMREYREDGVRAACGGAGEKKEEF